MGGAKLDGVSTQPPRDWFWLKAGGLLFAVAGAVAWLNPALGVPYLVTAVLFLPLLLPFLFSARVRRWEDALGGLGRIVLFAALFLYLAAVKSLLAPVILAELGYVAA